MGPVKFYFETLLSGRTLSTVDHKHALPPEVLLEHRPCCCQRAAVHFGEYGRTHLPAEKAAAEGETKPSPRSIFL